MGKTSCVRIQASMGPPFENGGGVAQMVLSPVVRVASMGPPFENGGGEADFAPRGQHGLSASMGPPFENGGGLL